MGGGRNEKSGKNIAQGKSSVAFIFDMHEAASTLTFASRLV